MIYVVLNHSFWVQELCTPSQTDMLGDVVKWRDMSYAPLHVDVEVLGREWGRGREVGMDKEEGDSMGGAGEG